MLIKVPEDEEDDKIIGFILIINFELVHALSIIYVEIQYINLPFAAICIYMCMQYTSCDLK